MGTNKDKKRDIEIDFSALQYNLSLTPSQRLEQHQASLELVWELERASKRLYEKPQPVTKTPFNS